MKKGVMFLFFIGVVAVFFAGAALAMEMTGQVTAADHAKGTLMIKHEKIDVGFDCEQGSLMKDVKVGDSVTVEYKEVGGKKKATKITPMTVKKKPSVGC